jgi:large subunit ribosomal protein L31
MKQGIHPDYRNAKLICACGNIIETRSTKGDYHMEVCSACHPFFTGKHKLMDTEGRVERFRKKYAGQAAAAATATAAAAAKK